MKTDCKKIEQICIKEGTEDVKNEAFTVYKREGEYFTEVSKGLFQKLIEGIKKIIESIFKKSDKLNDVKNTDDLKVYTNVRPEDLKKALDEANAAVKKPKFSKGMKIAMGTAGALVLAKGLSVISAIKKAGGCKVYFQPIYQARQSVKDKAKYEYSFIHYKELVNEIKTCAKERLVAIEKIYKNWVNRRFKKVLLIAQLR